MKVLFLLLTIPAEASNCKNSQPCGNSCISWSKTCHIGGGGSAAPPARVTWAGDSPSDVAPMKTFMRKCPYITEKGDTVASVAVAANVIEQNVIVWNHLTEPYALYAGQNLFLDDSCIPTFAPDELKTEAEPWVNPIAAACGCAVVSSPAGSFGLLAVSLAGLIRRKNEEV